MNATAQRMHRTVTQGLEERIAALETLVTQVSKNGDWLKQRVDELTDYSKASMKLAEQHDKSLHALLGSADVWLSMSFMARLRWLFLGR